MPKRKKLTKEQRIDVYYKAELGDIEEKLSSPTVGGQKGR